MAPPKARSLPCVLVFAGVDPGGGAGLFADARAIAAEGAFACGVPTLLTVQSTAGVKRVLPITPRDVLAQAREVVLHQRVRAMKVGALGEAPMVRAVARFLRAHPELPAVVDTPMLPSRGGSRLLRDDAVHALRAAIVPRATVLTVNAPEAAALTGMAVTNVREAEAAALALAFIGARAVLVKGGHLGGERAIDVLVVGGRVVRLQLPRLKIPSVHGTGCALASIIAAKLACREASTVGDELIELVCRTAKARLHRELKRSYDVGEGQRVLRFDRELALTRARRS